MGRKLDALLGRRYRRASKLRTAVDHAVTRLVILKNQRHARFTVAHSDIIELLRLNHLQQALLRVEQVIKNQNMLVVYDMIHEYCHLLKQRINLIEQENDCPDELKEAVPSLLYAAPRCGEFPELQEIRAILTARFGKELSDSVIELRSKSGVSQKMIQKLSSKELTLENRKMMLIRIAREDGIVLQLEAMILPEKNEKVFEPATCEAAATQVVVELTHSESLNSKARKSTHSRLKNDLNSELVTSKHQMTDSSSIYDSDSNYEEIIEEDEGQRSKHNIEVEELDDLYSNDYSDDDNIKTSEKTDFGGSKYKTGKKKTGFPSRTEHFSSYRQFPFRHQANLKAEVAR